MRIYFSGNGDLVAPERLLREREPNVMLSFSYLNSRTNDKETKKRLMRIYFSGGLSFSCHPETLMPSRKPHVMMSFNYINSEKEKRPRKRLKGFAKEDFCRIGSLFIDSGAFTLFIEKAGRGKNYDFYSLKPGSEFRIYCDQYAKFIRKLGDNGIVANVDVIYEPKKTFEVQRFFEQEQWPEAYSGSSLQVRLQMD